MVEQPAKDPKKANFKKIFRLNIAVYNQPTTTKKHKK